MTVRLLIATFIISNYLSCESYFACLSQVEPSKHNQNTLNMLIYQSNENNDNKIYQLTL